MTFIYPLGFLALAAIPVLILIYIIKNRYTEQTVTSTYIWNLSEKFLKRRIPINRISGLLSLLIQILLVTLVAFIIARPVLTLPHAAKAYCFILDGSGSMNIVQDDKSRFDIGREKIKEIINDSMNGSTYTLIYAGDSTETIFEGYVDKERAVEAVDNLEVSCAAVDFSQALLSAQEYFNADPRTVTYLVTDKTYGDSQNVNIVNVSAESSNYAISDIDYDLTADRTLKITGNVVSYTGDAELTLNLYLDGSETALATVDLDVKEAEATPFVFEEFAEDFFEFRLAISESDDLSLDSQVTVFNIGHENMSATLLVSDGPIYLRAALNAAGFTDFKYLTSEEYEKLPEEERTTGYGLYIYEDYVPEVTPREGAVWYVNPDKSPEGGNFGFQRQESATDVAEFNTSSKTAVRNMLKGVIYNADGELLDNKSFHISKYVKLSVRSGFDVYATCGSDPLLFTGANEYGNREAVFAFSPKDSADFTLTATFVTLINNLKNYSFPQVVEETSYFCGDIAQINMIPGCKSIRVESPLGKVSYPDTSTTLCEFELKEVGAYGIFLTMSDDSEREINIYVSLPTAERVPFEEGEAFIIQGAAEEGGPAGVIDDLLIIFILIAVVAAVDYAVYSYEQYQLR